MNRIISSLLLMLSIAVVLHASDKALILKIGPVWPRVLLGSDHQVAWDASVISGAIIDKRVTIGGGIDFLWNYYSKETKIQDNTYKKEREEKTFMFPISGYLSLSPVPDFKVCPVLSGQLGIAPLYYFFKDPLKNAMLNTDTLIVNDNNGWYIGFYWKLALDAVASLSENVGFNVGLDYQHSKPRKKSKQHKDAFEKRDMSGVGIRAGLSFIL